MRSFLSLVCLLVASLSIFCDITYANPYPCKLCKTTAECNEDPPQVCVWGEATDFCGRRVCSKGPGERCGGWKNVLGLCGEGMLCKQDEKCHGCSLQTMLCYN